MVQLKAIEARLSNGPCEEFCHCVPIASHSSYKEEPDSSVRNHSTARISYDVSKEMQNRTGLETEKAGSE